MNGPSPWAYFLMKFAGLSVLLALAGIYYRPWSKPARLDITATPPSLVADQDATLTITGAPGTTGKVFQDRQDQSLPQSVGSFVLDGQGTARLKVRPPREGSTDYYAQSADDRLHSPPATVLVENGVAIAGTSVTVIAPLAGAKVEQTATVRGTALPGTAVTIRSKATPRFEVVADHQGTWRTSIDLASGTDTVVVGSEGGVLELPVTVR